MNLNFKPIQPSLIKDAILDLFYAITDFILPLIPVTIVFCSPVFISFFNFTPALIAFLIIYIISALIVLFSSGSIVYYLTQQNANQCNRHGFNIMMLLSGGGIGLTIMHFTGLLSQIVEFFK